LLRSEREHQSYTESRAPLQKSSGEAYPCADKGYAEEKSPEPVPRNPAGHHAGNKGKNLKMGDAKDDKRKPKKIAARRVKPSRNAAQSGSEPRQTANGDWLEHIGTPLGAHEVGTSRHVKGESADYHQSTNCDGRHHQGALKKKACPAEDKDCSDEVGQTRNSRQPRNHWHNLIVWAKRMTGNVRADQCLYAYPNYCQRKEQATKSCQHNQPRYRAFHLI
jgi:hypothetical protein